MCSVSWEVDQMEANLVMSKDRVWPKHSIFSAILTPTKNKALAWYKKPLQAFNDLFFHLEKDKQSETIFGAVSCTGVWFSFSSVF